MLSAVCWASLGVCALSLPFISGWWSWRTAERRAARRWKVQCEQERAAAVHLCFSTIESLVSAMEAGDPYNAGNVDCVVRIVSQLACTLQLT